MAINVDRDQKIIALWKDGKSSGWVAGHLGVTRNVVMGVVHRAGLRRSPKVVTTKKRDLRRRRPVPSVTPRVPQKMKPSPQVEKPRRGPIVEPAGKPVHITELTRLTCRWPLENLMSCGARVKPDSVYCQAHYERTVRRI